MRTDSRLNILIFGCIVLLGGGALYGGVRLLGISEATAQTGASVLLLLGFVVWTAGYLSRVLSGRMSLHRQQQVYETERLRQQIEQMSPEQLAALQAEIEAEERAEPNHPQDQHPQDQPEGQNDQGDLKNQRSPHSTV